MSERRLEEILLLAVLNIVRADFSTPGNRPAGEDAMQHMPVQEMTLDEFQSDYDSYLLNRGLSRQTVKTPSTALDSKV